MNTSPERDTHTPGMKRNRHMSDSEAESDAKFLRIFGNSYKNLCNLIELEISDLQINIYIYMANKKKTLFHISGLNYTTITEVSTYQEFVATDHCCCILYVVYD